MPIAETSAAIQYIKSKGWTYKASGTDKIELETCPLCHKTNYAHFYMVADGTNREGLWACHRCGEQGNLTTLKEKMGDKIVGVSSVSTKSEIESLPDIEAAHQALLEDGDAMDYLINTRGFSREIIEKQKLGLSIRYFRECGEVRALLYPYFVNGNCVFVHWRTLPPSPKAFSSLKGWDAPLYNGEILREGITEITAVEGEANTIAALDHGITDIIGVPGANFKKAMWVDTLDQLKIERIYVCYDKDKVGQKAAQVLASRIGIEKCYKIVLPDFKVPTEDGERSGKDLNEWFVYGGGTAEGFNKLKEEAQLFDVQGVVSSAGALDDLEERLNGRDTLRPTYDTPWESLSNLVGFEDGDTIDIVAPEKIGKTTFALNLLEYQVRKTEEDGILICLEMPTERQARKWVSHITQTDDSIPKTIEEDKFRLAAMRAAVPKAKEIAANRKGQLYFCYPKIDKVEDAYKLIIDCIRRYGVKWVCFDNLQKLCDRTLKNQAHRTIHLSQISKVFDSIAKDYGIKFIRILQPKRIQKNQILTTDDVDGSSQVAKDCDCMITLHRNPTNQLTQNDFEAMGYAEAETSFESKMLVTVGLSRYSSGGYTTLEFDGARSSVFEYDEKRKFEFVQNRPTVGYELPKEKLLTPTSGPAREEEKVSL